MGKEYGILKIEKLDTDKTSKIKVRNNNLIKNMSENRGYTLASGILGGVSLVMFFATMKACRDDAYVGSIVAGAVGTVVSSLSSAIFGIVSKKIQDNNQKEVGQISSDLVKTEEEQALRLRSKNSIDKVLRGE